MTTVKARVREYLEWLFVFEHYFVCDAEGVGQRVQVCGERSSAVSFRASTLGGGEFVFSASESVFVVTVHMNRFTTSFHEAMEFLPLVAHV